MLAEFAVAERCGRDMDEMIAAGMAARTDAALVWMALSVLVYDEEDEEWKTTSVVFGWTVSRSRRDLDQNG